MLSVMDRKEEIRRQILDKARRQGSMSYDEILALLPDAERDVALLDDIMDDLLDAGVEVTTALEAEADDAVFKPNRHNNLEVELEWLEDEGNEYGAWLAQDLTQDAGYQQALESDDVVGLYLKEAGRVPLLTAEEEVMLAKRMEAAGMAQSQLDEYGEQLPMDDVYTLRDLISDGELAQEHLVRANARLVISVAKKYIGRGVQFLDLIQEGNIGLIRATRNSTIVAVTSSARMLRGGFARPSAALLPIKAAPFVYLYTWATS